MRRIFLSATAFAILCGGLGTTLWGQPATRPAAAPTAPHKVGLIDMAKVFKDYKKFGNLREDLKVQIQKSDETAKGMAVAIQKLGEQMKQSDTGSAQFLQYERELAKKTSEFETYRKVQQRDFLRKESQIYKTVYLEAINGARMFAQHFKYSLIIRFNSEQLDTADPQKLIQGLNRQVIYHRAEDDITASVIDYLNRNYERTATAPRTATPSGTRTNN